MRWKIKSWIRKDFAGFIAATTTITIMGLLSWLSFFQCNLVTIALVYISTLIIVEYMHNNPIRDIHIFTIFWWIFYAYVGPGIAGAFKSTITGALASIIPICLHQHFYSKEKEKKKKEKEKICAAE